MTNVEALKKELAQSVEKTERVSELMGEVVSKLEEVQIRMGNALIGTGDQELQNVCNEWAARALKDANEVAEIMPSISTKLKEYMSRF